MIERPIYLKKLVESKQNGFPKVITGIRRCGKSFLLKEIYKKYLIEQGVKEEDILVIDLDNDSNYQLRNPIQLGNYVRTWAKGKYKTFVFIDEIQKVLSIKNPIFNDNKIEIANTNDEDIITFVDVILGLSKEKNIDLYVTGSNSKMLSSDIITEFRDKATNIELYPLSFQEFYQYKGGLFEDALNEYLTYGGMPLTVLKSNDEKKEYLKSLFNLTYLKDIVERNKIRNKESLEDLSHILSECIGQLSNVNNLSNTFMSVKHKLISPQTIYSYILFFIDAFIIKEANRYDVKGKKIIGSLKKYYFTDLGLRNAKLNFIYSDLGPLLENFIFNELIIHGYSVNIGTFQSYSKLNNKTTRTNYEIDFFAIKNNRKLYIQVCNDLNEITKDREIKPYLLLNDQIQKVIVINRNIEETRDSNEFTIIGLKRFLFNFI